RAGEWLTLNATGWAYYHFDRKRKAQKSFEQALAVSREIMYSEGEARTLIGLGYLYRALGRKDRAREYLERSLTILRNTKDRKGEIEALEGLSLLVMSSMSSGLDKAPEYDEKALGILHEIGEHKKEAAKLIRIGWNLYFFRQNNKAIEVLSRALVVTH